MITASPLQWPAHWPRTRLPQRSNFGSYTFERMRMEVLRELKLLKATDVVISSNLRIRQDGFPYSGQRQPDDTGIAVYFMLNGQQQCIPCDKWTKVEDNLRAIVKTIEALRGIERWGAKEMVDAAFTGFKALPEAVVTPPPVENWWIILDVDPWCSYAEAKRAYREKAMEAHPDRPGGSEAEFKRVEKAWQEAQTATSQKDRS